MARALLLALPMLCAIPITAEAGDETQSRPERRSCVDLPPMAKNKKCREMPAMAAPDPATSTRRRSLMEIRALEQRRDQAVWTQMQASGPR